MKKALRVILPLLVLLFGVAATGLLIYFKKPVQAEPALSLPRFVKTVIAQRTNHQFKVQTQGTVMPHTEIQLVPEVSGMVIEMSSSMEEGGFFEKDEWLFTIDPRDFELAVTRAEAQVAEARYRLAFEQAEAKVAREEWESLGSEGQPNPLLLRDPQLAQAKANLSSAEAALEQAQRDLRRCHIKAPFAGRVGAKSIDPGQYVTQGTPVARLFAIDYAEVRLPLSAEDLAFVTLPLAYRGEESSFLNGPEVLITAQVAGEKHVWKGFIERTEGEMDRRTRMLFAVARIEDPYGRSQHRDRPPLVMGLFVNAEIQGKTIPDAIVLPRLALRGKDQVLVVDDQDTLDIRTVSILRATEEHIILRADGPGGLQGGERICVTPLDVVTSNMKVLTDGSSSGHSRAEAGAGKTRHE